MSRQRASARRGPLACWRVARCCSAPTPPRGAGLHWAAAPAAGLRRDQRRRHVERRAGPPRPRGHVDPQSGDGSGLVRALRSDSTLKPRWAHRRGSVSTCHPASRSKAAFSTRDREWKCGCRTTSKTRSRRPRPKPRQVPLYRLARVSLRRPTEACTVPPRRRRAHPRRARWQRPGRHRDRVPRQLAASSGGSAADAAASACAPTAGRRCATGGSASTTTSASCRRRRCR